MDTSFMLQAGAILIIGVVLMIGIDWYKSRD